MHLVHGIEEAQPKDLIVLYMDMVVVLQPVLVDSADNLHRIDQTSRFYRIVVWKQTAALNRIVVMVEMVDKMVQ